MLGVSWSRARSTPGPMAESFRTPTGRQLELERAALCERPGAGRRPAHPEHALRRDRRRRGLSEHQQRRQLESGSSLAWPAWSLRWSSTPIPPARSTSGPLAAGSPKAPIAGTAGARSTPACHLRRPSGRWPSTRTPRARSTPGPVGGGVFQSTNSGASWTAVNTGLTGLVALRAGHRPTHPEHALRRDRFWRRGLSEHQQRRQLECGQHRPESTRRVDALAIDPHTPSTLYAGHTSTPGCSAGRLQSTNSGASWSPVNTGLTSLDVNALAIDPITTSTLYAGTGAGVFDIELACIVGTGTSASCTESALDACLPGGAAFNGPVTFNCGGAATITVTSTKTISADTTIDGGGFIEISGGGTRGRLYCIPGSDPGPSQRNHQRRSRTSGDSASSYGGAIYNNGTLTVTDSSFSGNSSGLSAVPSTTTAPALDRHRPTSPTTAPADTSAAPSGTTVPSL